MLTLDIVDSAMGAQASLLKGTRVVLQRLWPTSVDEAQSFILACRPSVARVTLEASSIDSQFISIQGLSWYDRHCLTRQLLQQNTSSSHILPPVKSNLPPTSQPTLVITSCYFTLSSISILQTLKSSRIPIKNLTVDTYSIPSSLLSTCKIETPWSCCLYTVKESLFLAITLSATGQPPHVLLVRRLSRDSNCADEILQSFHYLSRKTGTPIDTFSVFQTSHTSPLSSEDFPSPWKVTVTRLSSPSAKALDSTLDLSSLRPLRRLYVWPRYLQASALTFGSFSLLATLKNCYQTHIEHRKQTLTSFQNRTLSSTLSLAELTHQLQQAENTQRFLDVIEYQTTQSWPAQNFLSATLATLSSIHKNQFLQSLSCEQKVGQKLVKPSRMVNHLKEKTSHSDSETSNPETSLVLKVDLSPRELYQDGFSSKNLTSALKRCCEASTQLARTCLTKRIKQPATLSSRLNVERKLITLNIQWSNDNTPLNKDKISVSPSLSIEPSSFKIPSQKERRRQHNSLVQTKTISHLPEQY